MNFSYDKWEKDGACIYFYEDEKIVAVYNPFVGLCKKKRT